MKIDQDMLLRKAIAVVGLFAGGGALCGVVPGKAGLEVTLLAGTIVGLGRSLTMPSGVAHPISPGEVTFWKAFVQGIVALCTIPQAKRAQALAAERDALLTDMESKFESVVMPKLREMTLEMVRDEAGRLVEVAKNPAVASGPATAEAPPVVEVSAPSASADAAITATGGNQ